LPSSPRLLRNDCACACLRHLTPADSPAREISPRPFRTASTPHMTCASQGPAVLRVVILEAGVPQSRNLCLTVVSSGSQKPFAPAAVNLDSPIAALSITAPESPARGPERDDTHTLDHPAAQEHGFGLQPARAGIRCCWWSRRPGRSGREWCCCVVWSACIADTWPSQLSKVRSPHCCASPLSAADHREGDS
jgi:hypothetical protein